MFRHHLTSFIIVSIGLAIALTALAVSFEIAPRPEPDLHSVNIMLSQTEVLISAYAFDVSGVYTVVALIRNTEDILVDPIKRLTLFDDGRHKDGGAKDNTFANSAYLTEFAEGRYYVSIFALDTIGYKAEITNAAWFDIVLPGVCTPGDSQSQACGNCGTQTRTCQKDGYWNIWGSCLEQKECSPETTLSADCGNCGTQSKTCQADCTWPTTWGSCTNEGVCSSGAAQNQSCGTNGNQTRTCQTNCTWSDWATCREEGPCTAGETETEACGNCGSWSRTCQLEGYWSAWDSCTGPGVCSPDSSQSQACGNCGHRIRICSDTCAWGDWGPCTGQGVCTPGTAENRSCGTNGAQTRTCQTNCSWSEWDSCQEVIKAECTAGETQEKSCGYCGTQNRTCQENGRWPLEWEACTGQGVCSRGSAEIRACGNCGYEIRTCTDVCGWTVWSGCIREGVCVAGAIDTPDCPCPLDGCYGTPNYYDYPAYGNCTSYCTCATSTGTGQPCQPTITANSPSCDSIAPTTSISPNGQAWGNVDVAFTLTCSDNLSGCQTTQYKVIASTATCDTTGLSAGTSGTVSCASGSVCQSKVCYRSQDKAANWEAIQTSNIFYIDKTAPSYGGYSNISGYSYKESDTVYWVKGGDNLQIDIAHTDTGSGVFRQYFGFNKDDCAPNYCGGAPNEIKSYSNYGSGLNDLMADNTYIDISAVSCSDPDLVCSDDDMTLRWTSNIKATCANWDYKLHTFQYDKTWNGLGYTDLGVWVKVDNTAPSAPTFSPLSSDWAASASVTVTYSDAGSGIQYTRHCWTTSASCDPGTSAASTFSNGGTISQTSPGQWNLCTRASDKAGNWDSTACSGPYKVGQCTPGSTTTCTSPQGCSHTITCQSDYTWPTCPTDACVAGAIDTPACPCPADGCYGTPDYYDYPPNGDCTTACACDTGTGAGQPCQPTITANSPSCDGTAPSTSISPNGQSWGNVDVAFTLTCSDNLSGCQTTQYKVIASTATCDTTGLTAGTSGTVSCASGSVCQSKVCYRSQDKAGNWEAIKTSNIFYIDKLAPSHDSLTVGNQYWKIDGTTQQTITLKSTETGSGFGGSYGIMALINYQGSNVGNYRGYFAWHPAWYVWLGDQVPCTGGGYASKYNGTSGGGYGKDYITLTGCSTSVSGEQRTVVFTVLPGTNFGDFGPINDISMYTTDAVNNARGWTNFDINFVSDGTAPTSDWTSSGFGTYDTDGTASAVTQCSDATSGVKDVYVAWKENNAWTGYVYQPYPYTCVSFGTTGQYIQCAVRCRDNADNLDASWDYTTNSYVDTAKPTVDITSHTENDTYYSNTGSFTMSGTAADVGSGLQKVVWNSDGAYETGTIDLASPGDTWSKTWTSVPEGQSWMYIASYDLAGNFSGWNWRVSWIVDQTAPGAPTFSPASSDWAVSASVTVTYSDAGSGIQYTRHCWTTAASCDPGTSAASTFTNGSSITQSTNGVWNLCTRASDKAGNWAATACSGPYKVGQCATDSDCAKCYNCNASNNCVPNPALSCTITSGSCSGQAVLKLSATSNAHAELSTQANYNHYVCCTGAKGLGNSCSDGDTVLKLSKETNAHVEKKTQANYAYSACLSTVLPAQNGTVSCTYATACASGYTCLASIDKDTNSQIGDCNAYTTKVCCTILCQ